jgi:hypothetical protein
MSLCTSVSREDRRVPGCFSPREAGVWATRPDYRIRRAGKLACPIKPITPDLPSRRPAIRRGRASRGPDGVRRGVIPNPGRQHSPVPTSTLHDRLVQTKHRTALRTCGVASMKGHCYITHKNLDESKAYWLQRLKATIRDGGFRRVKRGETFLHGPDGRVEAKVCANVPAPDPFECMDCDQSTDEMNEYYMVHDHVWRSVVKEKAGMLCIGCLEHRLKRQLHSQDFKDVILHSLPARSPRLQERLSAPPPPPL